MFKRNNRGLDQALTSGPVLIVEVKNLDDQKSINVLNHLPQLLEQLRSTCFVYGLLKCYGVLTDFKDWYFVQFNFAEEI